MDLLNDKVIKLVEVARTWQGEGVHIGRQMLIVRFKYCNRHCSFCDTWIKMKSSSEGLFSITDINNEIQKTGALMITGGEPTFSDEKRGINNFYDTMLILNNCKYQIADIETNGYDLEKLIFEIQKTCDTKKISIMYSPKVFNEQDYEIAITNVRHLIKKPFLFVKIVANKLDITEKFIREISTLTDDKGKIYLMPMGTTVEEITKNWNYCVDLADEVNINISTRMHIMHSFT